MIRSVHIVYASTSGHTEYVVDALAAALALSEPSLSVERRRAELTASRHLLLGDLLILASGTWNTGGSEGSLNPHMHELLLERARDADLSGRAMTCISLGDERYYYRTRCTEHFLRFQREHGAVLFFPPLILLNEPYGQEEKIRRWADKLLGRIRQDNALPRRAGIPAAASARSS